MDLLQREQDLTAERFDLNAERHRGGREDLTVCDFKHDVFAKEVSKTLIDSKIDRLTTVLKRSPPSKNLAEALLQRPHLTFCIHVKWFHN